MDNNNLGKQILSQSMENIEQTARTIMQEPQQETHQELQKETHQELQQKTQQNPQPELETTVSKDNKTPVNNSTADSFAGLPIESLICAPIIAAAKGQQELTAVYIDGLKKIAYATDKNGKSTDETNVLSFTVNRPVTTQDGKMTTEPVKIEAPLLPLVPLPAFTMDELTVDFNMEVKDSNLQTDTTKSDVSSTVSFKSWFGLDAKITGNISAESTHKRETDSSATYKIHARAIQQPPTEGMNKLTDLLVRMMEPVSSENKKP